MERFLEILKIQVGDNKVYDFGKSFVVFLILYLALYLFKSVAIRKLDVFSKKTKTQFGDELIRLIKEVPHYLYFLISLYFSLKMIVMGEFLEKSIDAIFLIVVVFYGVKILQSVFEYMFSGMFRGKEGRNAQRAATTAYGLSLVIKFVLWSVGILLVLANLGVNITSLIAGLGIGGVAIALALQNILGDIFSSFSIYFDRPFEVGDYITIGPDQGTVKNIGLKSTRIETLDGEELVVSNHELTTTRVQNFKKMKKRRILFNIGVVYGTPNQKLEKVNEMVKKIIDEIEGVEFARCFFTDFGDHALIFEIVFFVDSGDYDFALEKKQKINFAIKEQFEKEGIEMAFPTQTVHMVKD